MTKRAANLNMAWARHLAAALSHAGVGTVCVCPGSRCAPLALAIDDHEGLDVVLHVDERAAAFFALGHARRTGEPTVVLCSSGSAGTHFYPAITEAYHARLPLVAITANRPWELHGCGAPQAMDQSRLFGTFAPTVELREPTSEPGVLRATTRRIASTIAGTMGCGRRRGPAHFDVPMRDPLHPAPVPFDLESAPGQMTFHVDPHQPRPERIRTISKRLQGRAGVIAVGPQHGGVPVAPDAVEAFKVATGWPVLADPLSCLRGEGTARHYDAWLRGAGSTLAPDVILEVGGPLTSKAYHLWRRGLNAWTLRIDPAGQPRDWVHQTDLIWQTEPAAALVALANQLEPSGPAEAFATVVARLEAVTKRHTAAALEADALWEGTLAHDVAKDARRRDGLLWVASSMPVRDVDSFAGTLPSTVLSNRGVNGIDGTIASALGAAWGAGVRCNVLIGDVALLHDVGSLALLGGSPETYRGDVKIVVADNGGGRIFQHLPLADHWTQDNRRLFETTHTLDLARVCAGFGLSTSSATDRASLREALDGPTDVVVASIDPDDNLDRHRAYFAAVAADVHELLEEG